MERAVFIDRTNFKLRLISSPWHGPSVAIDRPKVALASDY
jgi:hypothetical protein